MRIELLDCVSSTNEYIRRYLSAGENVAVCARRQTEGRGTKGRSFLSGEGGVYLSALWFYKNFPAERAFEVMAHAAVSVCRTAEFFGASPEIKWPNDVLLHGRKLCGILIENGLSGGMLTYSIVGIGINVANDLSPLGGIASSLSEVSSASPEAVRDALLKELVRPSTFVDYLVRVRFLGGPVQVEEGGRVYEARAEEILPDGRLAVEENNCRRALSSAEVRLVQTSK